MEGVEILEDDLRPSEVSTEHLQASADALTELARVVSSPMAATSEVAPLFVDLVHYEHGYFLSPVLRGFSMLSSAGGHVELPEPPSHGDDPEGFAFEVLANWAEREEIEGLFSRRANALVNPRGATDELPFTWATVAGHPVADQVREVLESLASLLARQTVTRDLLADAGSALPAQLQSIEADMARVTTGVKDSVVRSGWRAAAQELRLRSEKSGRPLRVRYRSTVFDAAELRERAPLLREAYNRLPPVRKAVDRTASAMARAMYIGGDVPAELLQSLNDQFEHFGMRQFLAHTIRDSFVCGNGVLVLDDVLSGSIRLLPPDVLVEVSGEVATIQSTGQLEQVKPVLHLQGGRQVGSDLGMSFLEPFVITCANRDTFLSVLLTSEVILASGTLDDEARSWASQMKPYAEAQLQQISDKTLEVLGHATDQFVDAAEGTYFEGQERMTPSAGRMTLVESFDDVVSNGIA